VSTPLSYSNAKSAPNEFLGELRGRSQACRRRRPPSVSLLPKDYNRLCKPA
jgi:hypothetical protein